MDFPEPIPPVSPTTSTAAEPTIGVIELQAHEPRVGPNGPADDSVTGAPAEDGVTPFHGRSARRAPQLDLLARFGPFVVATRWATVAAGLALAALDDREPLVLLQLGIPLVAYAALRTVRPLRYLTGRVTSLVMVLAEVALTLGVVVASGFWSSPYAFCLASAIVAAGFARGFGFAIRTSATAVAAVAIPYHLEVAGADPLTTVQWGGELLLVALVAGYARRLFGEAEEQSALARQANDLLTQLNAVAQTLPASLDLDETLAATIAQLRELFTFDAIVILLREEASDPWTVAAAEGVRLPAILGDTALPSAAAEALVMGQPVRATGRRTFATDAAVGIYLPLRARDRLVGLVAVESWHPESLGDREVELGGGVAGQAALALDNARWFSRLRRVGADEERSRIARDLHDRVGQSLAFVSFELDRISRQAGGQPVEEDLLRLREDVRRVVTEVRETLYDLRTDVSERKDLVAVLSEFSDRVAERTGIDVRFDYQVERRLPLRQEREVWRVAQEAVTNACRHAEPTVIHVSWRCGQAGAVLHIHDDGKGFPSGGGRADSYGVLGMRERAAAIGGRLSLTSKPGQGTDVRLEVAA